jgi:hypothetical protein
VAVVRILFRGTKFTDLCYGYNAYWARVAPLLLDAGGFEIETVMNLRAVRANLRTFEVPSFETARINGEGKLQTFPDGWKVLKAIVRERFFARPIDVDASLLSGGRGAQAREAVMNPVQDAQMQGSSR